MLVVKTKLREAGQKGIGLFADQKINKDDVIWVWDTLFGKWLTDEEVESLPELNKQFVKKYATKEKNGKWLLDLDDTRFLNHSDNHNLGFFEDYGIVVSGIALRDIEIGEEITCNYFEVMPGIKELNFDNLENK